MIKVKLLVSRTGVGKLGDVVEYEPHLAEEHSARGLVRIVGEDEDENDDASAGDAPRSKPARRKPTPDRKPNE